MISKFLILFKINRLRSSKQIILLIAFAQITANSQMYQTFIASGSDACLGYDMNVEYMEYNVYNGAPIYINEETPNVNKYLIWQNNKWKVQIYDYNISQYKTLNENTTGTNLEPPLTGWVATSLCAGLTAIGLSEVILPIELVSLNVELRNNNSIITWKTASETNNQGFEIQYAEDGGKFENIGWVYGNGNSNIKFDYQFVHTNPKEGNNNYRLKQIDNDGTFEYSDITTLFLSTGDITIYPNPLTDQLYIKGTEECNYEIHDKVGKSIMNGLVENESINTSSLPVGQYFISIQNQGHLEKRIFYKK